MDRKVKGMQQLMNGQIISQPSAKAESVFGPALARFVLVSTLIASVSFFLVAPKSFAQNRQRRQNNTQEYEVQWSGYILTYCYPDITVQLDHDFNRDTPKGTIARLTMTSHTIVEGNSNWPKATVEFLPSTRLVSHVWFLPPAVGSPRTRDEGTPCTSEEKNSGRAK